jgi:glycopeptide antibiotics resistance protein
MNRNRFYSSLLIIAAIAAGLAFRHFSNYLPLWNKLYLGDALWALMVFFMVGFIFKTKSPIWVAVFALAFSFSIEFSQLYHATWIDTIRDNRIGGLILGYGFLWSDLICYSVGIGVGLLFERIVFKNVLN